MTPLSSSLYVLLAIFSLASLSCSGNFYEEPEGIFPSQEDDEEEDDDDEQNPLHFEPLPKENLGPTYTCSNAWEWWVQAQKRHYLFGAQKSFETSSEESLPHDLTQVNHKNLIHNLTSFWFSHLDPQRVVFAAEDLEEFRQTEGINIENQLSMNQDVAYCDHLQAMQTLHQNKKSHYLKVFQKHLWMDQDFTLEETYPRYVNNFASSQDLEDRVRAHMKLIFIRTWNVFPELSYEDIRFKLQKELQRQKKALAQFSQEDHIKTYLKAAFEALDPYSHFWDLTSWNHAILRANGWLATLASKYIPALETLTSLSWKDGWTESWIQELTANNTQVISITEKVTKKENKKNKTPSQKHSEVILRTWNMEDNSLDEFFSLAKGKYSSELIIKTRGLNKQNSHDSPSSYIEKTQRVTRQKLLSQEREDHHYIFDVFADNDETSKLSVGALNVKKFQNYSEDYFVGYIENPKQFHEYFSFLENLDALVLDLRDHGGGSDKKALEILNLFMEEEVAFYKHYLNNQGKLKLESIANLTPEGFAFTKLPLVILVNRFTASAAELIALALRSHGRAIIVGDTQSKGKGTSHISYNWSSKDHDKVIWRVSVGEQFGVDGASIPKDGLISDVVIPSLSDLSVNTKKNFLYKNPHHKTLSFPKEHQPSFDMRSEEIIQKLGNVSLSRSSQREDFQRLDTIRKYFRYIWSPTIPLYFKPEAPLREDLLENPFLESYPNGYIATDSQVTTDHVVLAEAIRIALDYAYLLQGQEPPSSYRPFHTHSGSALLRKGWKFQGLPIE